MMYIVIGLHIGILVAVATRPPQFTVWHCRLAGHSER